MASVLNKLETNDFHKNGFVIVKDFFNKKETELLQNASTQDPAIRNHLYDRKQLIKNVLNVILDAEKIVVSMGRIQKKKGFDILINSFVDVLIKYPTAKLLIAGEDEGEQLTHVLAAIYIKEHMEEHGSDLKTALREYTLKVRNSIG